MSMSEEIANVTLPVRRWRSLALGSLWLGFVIYAMFMAPPSTPETGEMIRQLLTGAWTNLNPGVVVLFNLMGLWPVIYASLALTDGVDQAFPAWPFVLASFGLGAFALLPYLALREPTCTRPYQTTNTALLNVLNHRLMGMGVAIVTLLILAYGLSQGHWNTVLQDFLHEFSTSRFIHVMGLDFCLLTLIIPSLLWDDMTRRRVTPLWRSIFLLPLLGPALYLALRPTVSVSAVSVSTVTQANQ